MYEVKWRCLTEDGSMIKNAMLIDNAYATNATDAIAVAKELGFDDSNEYPILNVAYTTRYVEIHPHELRYNKWWDAYITAQNGKKRSRYHHLIEAEDNEMALNIARKIVIPSCYDECNEPDVEGVKITAYNIVTI